MRNCCAKLLLPLVLAASASHAAPLPAPVAALQKDRQQMAAALAASAAACVVRHDTNHAAFHGCIDWHSSVHATWALVAYTALTGDTRYEPVIQATLADDGLAQERELLERYPGFENPYGRAWFLRLAIEHERLSRSQKLRPLADAAAHALLERLERGVDPLAPEYRNPAWALANLIDWYDFTRDTEAAARARAIARRAFIDNRAPCDAQSDRRGFMAVCLTMALPVSRVLPAPEFVRWARERLPSDRLPTPVQQPRNAHEAGLNFSRAWGLWTLYAATRDPAYAEAYAAHVRTSYADASHWRGAYDEVGHWVAQFGMFALQPLFDVR